MSLGQTRFYSVKSGGRTAFAWSYHPAMTQRGVRRLLGDLAWISVLVVAGIAVVIAVVWGLLFYPPALIVVLTIGLILVLIWPRSRAKLPRKARLVLSVAIGVLLVLTVLWVRSGPAPEQVAAEDAVVRMISVVGASTDGEQVDLA